jgi:hypothetical protein
MIPQALMDRMTAAKDRILELVDQEETPTDEEIDKACSEFNLAIKTLLNDHIHNKKRGRRERIETSDPGSRGDSPQEKA